MSATEELRALLDERGVRHTDFCNVTTWKDSRGRKVNGYEHNGEISLRLTPEQAIAATLDAGECEMDAHGNCTACGEFVAKSWEHVRRFDGGYEAKPCRAHNYCPNCGRRCI